MNLKGKVSRIFMEKENGFKILVLLVENLRSIPPDKCNPSFPDSVTLVGVMKGVEVGYIVEASGEWENRPNGSYWPWQFKTQDVSVCEFETPILVWRFLAGLPCVGQDLATKIIRVFPNTCEVIEKSPRQLTMINGVTEQHALQISKAFKEEREKKSLSIFLKHYGLTNEEINKISAYYGTNALATVKSNPYCLCEDRFVSFLLSDRIGRDLGFAPDALCRLRCAMNHVLLIKAASKGHVYLTEDMLIEETNGFFRDNAAIEFSFSAEQLENKLHNLVANGELVCDNGRFYHPERYRNECDVAKILLRRIGHGSMMSGVPTELIMACMKLAEEDKGIILDDLQREAVMMAIVSSTVVITGGPGSGKSATRFCVN